MGAPEHWAALAFHLTDRQVHDAQGNAFDPRALVCRIGPGVEAWIQGQDPVKHHFPSVDAIWHMYGELAAELTKEGLQPWPFPGRHPADYAVCGPRPAMDTATPVNHNPAAEHGRRGQ